ncbi:aldo/keto reductase [Phenylobacterium immobile]|uniref:aldo/keto reductase n=1 Tax=Phenylobacterium immobile TaxID=21 RepID=UPI000B136760|nr:aldo/keto reductase [Phenylobacterium immobile]
MKYAPLGKTGVKVSTLALGTATFGVAPLAADCDRLVHAALDYGINYFDCANTYGDRASFDRPGAPPYTERESAEEILGRALKGRRNDVFISSKVQEQAGTGPNDRGLSRYHIFNQVERSLKRLGTDHIDLYYAHHPDPETPIEQTLRAFDDLVRQGKVRYIALSTYSGVQMMEALWTADKLGLDSPVANQVSYNIQQRLAEREISQICLKHGLSLTVFSPLAGGLFTPAVDEVRTHTGNARWGFGSGFSEAQLGYAKALKDISEEVGQPRTHLALAWLLRRPAVASAIIGPESLAELEANIAAADLELSPETLAAIDAIYTAPPAQGWF